MIHECQKVEMYIRLGKCARTQDGRLCLANGRYIPGGTPGKNLMERIDHCNASAAPTVQTNVVTADTMAYETTGAFIEEVPEEEETSDDEEVQLMFRMFANEMARKMDKGKRAAAKETAKPGGKLPTIPTPAPVPAAPKAHAAEPAFRFQSPVEDPAMAQKVLDRALDAPITISQRELLAVSVDVRKKVKDLVTGKRVATAGTSTSAVTMVQALYHTRSNDLVVAKPAAALRAIEGLLAG